MKQKLMIALAAVALALGSTSPLARAQSPEERDAAQAKANFDFEKNLHAIYDRPGDPAEVILTSHFASVFTGSDEHLQIPQVEAQMLALDGLALNPESEYFEAQFGNSKGVAKAFEQRKANQSMAERQAMTKDQESGMHKRVIAHRVGGQLPAIHQYLMAHGCQGDLEEMSKVMHYMIDHEITDVSQLSAISDTQSVDLVKAIKQYLIAHGYDATNDQIEKVRAYLIAHGITDVSQLGTTN